MDRNSFLEKSGIALAIRLAVAIVLSIFVFSLAYADEISASCGGHDHDYCRPNAEICNNNVDDDCDNNVDCLDSDCANGAICRELCSTYTTSQTCGSHLCYWLPVCNGPKISPYGSNNCLSESFNGTYANCSKQKCNAACESSLDCPSYLSGSTCFFQGNCSANSCTCTYSSQACPVAGSVVNGTCYYGIIQTNARCAAYGCGLNHSGMFGYDSCNETYGPHDGTGPMVLDILVTPTVNNGTFNISAAINDTKSPINASEYFLRPGNVSQNCGAPGSGVAIAPEDDGAFNNDTLGESVLAVSVKFESAGQNKACLQAQDAAGNWGNCTCVNFDVDNAAPSEEGNISLNGISGTFEELVCNTPPVLNVTFCDSLSNVNSAEYFLDMLVPGYGLNKLNNYSRLDGSRCSDFSGEINLSALSDGKHLLSGLAGRDALANRVSYDFGANYSFVKDSAPPQTRMVFSLSDYPGCDMTEANGFNLSRCFFVLNGTQITLNATDLGLQSSGNFAGNITTYYRLWLKINESANWTNAGGGVYLENETFNISLENSINYLFEFWSEDICGFNETHNFSLIIAVRPVCPDGLCRFGEDSSSCPSDCHPTVTPTSSSGSSGSGSTWGSGHWVLVNNTTSSEAVASCLSDWTCGEWSGCLNGIMTRECIDINNCTGEGVISPEVISQCAIEVAPMGYCGDMICQAEIGETEQTCPADCFIQESNAFEASPPTGNFLASPSGLLSALVLLLIIVLSAHLIHKRNKNPAKIKAK